MRALKNHGAELDCPHRSPFELKLYLFAMFGELPMCIKNSFCGCCGSPIFNGKTVCRSCVSSIEERGFVSVEHFDEWCDAEMDYLEANEFECEIAAQWGESVEDVMQHGFQPTVFEVESGFVEVDRVFLAEKEMWQRQFEAQTGFNGHLGA